MEFNSAEEQERLSGPALISSFNVLNRLRRDASKDHNLKKLPLLAFGLFMITTLRALAACRPVPGETQLWSKSSISWVWVGEVHGTSETPTIFGDLVCDALSHGRNVTVALERPATEQAAIDAILGSGDRRAATQELLNQPGWYNIFDGRSSQAMLQLLFRLRKLEIQHPSLRVEAVIDPSSFALSPAADDQAMGHSILALKGKQPNDLVMVLTGNVHGMKNSVFGYKTAAMYLPADHLISLQVTDAGGQAWTMSDRGCGVSPGGVPDKDKSRPFGVYLDPSLARVGLVDGILALGKPTTASSPANTAALAAAPCRQNFLSQQSRKSRKKTP